MEQGLGSGVPVPEGVGVWARKEFGGAELGNRRRSERLVRMAAGAASRPAGRITQIFDRDDDRQGAYGFVENERVGVEALVRQAGLACCRRLGEAPYAIVPVDGSNLTLRDRQGKRKLGPVGTDDSRARGLEVMNAIGLLPNGMPMGLMAQTWWNRPLKPPKKAKPRRGGNRRSKREAKRRARRREKRRCARTFQQKETRHWLEVVKQAQAARDAACKETRLWFQEDRGADFKEMLGYAVDSPDWFTIRAAQDRRTRDDEVGHLWATLEKTEPLGSYELNVPAGPKRTARSAHMEIRARRVTLVLRNRDKSLWREVTLGAVLTRETGTTPLGEEPIEWLLLTTHPLQDLEDACPVVKAYSYRWRVEQFHKTWKSTCHVEDTELRSPETIKRWATILAAVALRIERLTYLARTEPETPATAELAQTEIDAIILLKKPKGYRPGSAPPIGLAVRWIADLGGYTGKSSGGPPGSMVIGRGLKRIEPAVETLRSLAAFRAEEEK